MKKFISIVAAAMLLAGVVVAEEIKIATFKGNAQFLPAVESILKNSGYEVTPVVYDEQPDIIAALAKGDADLVFFLAQPIIAGVKGAQFISARLMNTDFCAITKDSSVVVKSPADLKKYKVGIMKGQPGQVAATRGVPNLVEVANEVEQFKALKAGEVDVIVSVRDLAVPMSRAAGLSDYIVCEPPVLKNPTFIAVSAKAASKKAELDELFKKALADGTWNKELGKIKR